MARINTGAQILAAGIPRYKDFGEQDFSACQATEDLDIRKLSLIYGGKADRKFNK